MRIDGFGGDIGTPVRHILSGCRSDGSGYLLRSAPCFCQGPYKGQRIKPSVDGHGVDTSSRRMPLKRGFHVFDAVDGYAHLTHFAISEG